MAEEKKRHGCLTAWLILMIVLNSIVMLVYLLATDSVRSHYPNAPGWAFPALVVIGAFNLVCSFALFQWKKWGFWGICVSSLVAVVVNLYVGLDIIRSLLGLVGVLLLFGVLHIGNANKGWPQLE